MSHHRKCDCCNSGNPCLIDGGFGTRFCLKVDLAGIMPNPWDLENGDECIGDCGYWVWQGGNIYSSFKVESLTGVNGSHILGGTGFGDRPVAAIRFKAAERGACERYTSTLVSKPLTIIVSIGCRNDMPTITSVSVNSRGGIGKLFEWGDNDGVTLEVGGSVTVSNQLEECFPVVFGNLDTTGGYAGFGGTATITILEAGPFGEISCEGPLSPEYVYAESCDGLERITVKIADITREFPYAELDGVLYIPTDETSQEDETPGYIWVDYDCSDIQGPEYAIARFCDNNSVTITYDPKLASPSDITCIYNGQRYILTNEESSADPVSVAFSELACDTPPGNYKIARRCDNGDEVSYDRDRVPLWARGGRYQGRNYDLTNEDTDDDPVAMLWSSFRCGDFPDCSDITDFNDPQCDLPAYRWCPQCRDPNDIGDPRPPHVGESPQSADPDDDESLIPLGDAVQRAIKLVTGTRYDGCAKCAKRKAVLNRFGNRVGRRILKKLERLGIM